MKTCTKCGETKSLEDFHKGKSGRDGRDNHCRECRSIASKGKRLSIRYERTNGTGIYRNDKGYIARNTSRIEGDHAFIELTNRQGQVVAEALVSVDDLPRILERGRWHHEKKPHTIYCSRTFKAGGKSHYESLHRFLMGSPAGLEVDHANGNGLDNRRENLRIVTTGENNQNRRYSRTTRSKSGVYGVHWKGGSRPWAVTIVVDGKEHQYGHFSTIEEATPVAEAARRALHTHCPENSTAATE